MGGSFRRVGQRATRRVSKSTDRQPNRALPAGTTPSPTKNRNLIIFWTTRQFIPITPEVLRAQPKERDSAANRAKCAVAKSYQAPENAWNTD